MSLIINILQKIFNLTIILNTVLVGLFANPLFALQQHNSPPYIYYHNAQDDGFIKDLDKNLKVLVPAMEEALGVKLKPPVRVYLSLTQYEFDQVTRGHAPNWAGGLAYPYQRKIVVKTPLFFNHGASLEELTCHELAHLLLYEVVGDEQIPKWFEEGFCSLLAGETRTGSMSLLGRAAAADRLMGLPRVDNVLHFSSQNANLAYVEALSAAQYFLHEFGWETIRNLLTGVKEGQPFDIAFESATSVNYETWQVEWLDYARRRYSVWALLDFDNILWILITVLGVIVVPLAFIRYRIQYKRLMQDDEGDHNDENDPIIPR